MSIETSNATNITSVQFKEQGSDPDTPASGFGRAFVKADGLYYMGDDGVAIGPLGVGAAIYERVDLTAQDADIAETAFARTYTNGLYRVSYYMVVTTADAGAAGSPVLTILWNDGTADQLQETFGIDLATAGLTATGQIILYVGDAQAPTYKTGPAIIEGGTITYGTAEYALHVTMEKL